MTHHGSKSKSSDHTRLAAEQDRPLADPAEECHAHEGASEVGAGDDERRCRGVGEPRVLKDRAAVVEEGVESTELLKVEVKRVEREGQRG